MKGIDQITFGDRENCTRHSEDDGALLLEPAGPEGASGLRMGKGIPVVGEVRFDECFQVLVGVELEGEKNVAALAGYVVAAQPYQLFQHCDARVLAGVGDLGPFVMPSAAGLQTPFPPEGGVCVSLLFKAPDGEHDGRGGSTEEQRSERRSYAGRPYSMW